MPRSRPRRAFIVLAALLGLVLLPAGAVVVWRLPLATWAANAALRWQGLPGSVTVAALTPHEIVLSDLRLGAEPPLRARRVVVHYRPESLLDGPIERITVEGLDAVAVYDEAGLRLPALQPLLDMPGDGGGAPAPPAAIRLLDARLRVDTPQGPVGIGADAEIAPAADGAIALAGELAVEIAGNGLRGTLAGRRRADGRLSGTLLLADGQYAGAGIEAPLAGGRLTLDWNPAREPLPRVAGTLRLERLVLRDLRLGETRLELGSDGAAANATLRAAVPGAAGAMTLRLDIQDALTPAPTAAVRLELAVESLAGLAPLLPVAGWSGGGRIDIEGFAALPALAELPAARDPAGWPAIDAAARIRLTDLTIPGQVADGALTLSLRATTPESGVLAVKLADAARFYGRRKEPFTLIAEPTEAPLAQVRWQESAAAGGLHLHLATPAVDGTAVVVYAVERQAEGWRIAFPTLAARAERLGLGEGLAGETVRIDATDARLDLGPDGLLARAGRVDLRAERVTHPQAVAEDIEIAADAVEAGADRGFAAAARLSIGRWRAAGLAGLAALRAEDIAWSPDRLSLRAAVAATADGSSGRARLAGGRLQADLAVAGGPGGLTASLQECATLGLELLVRDGQTVTGGPLRLCPGAEPLLRLAGNKLAAGVGLAASRWQVDSAPSGAVTVDLARHDLALDADIATGAWSVRAHGTGSALVAEALDAAAGGIALDLALSGRGGAATDGRARLSVAGIRDRRPAARFAPLSLAAAARLRDRSITADGTVSGPDGIARLTLDAEHRRDSGTGRARLATEPPLAFAEDGLQPQALAPLLRGLVTSVNGLLDVEITAAWGPDGLATGATVEATALGGQTPLAVLGGLDGRLAFTSLTPPQTAPRQRIRLASLDIGLPLAGGEAELTLLPDGRLALHSLGWPWAGGRIHLADEVIDPKAGTIPLTLRVDDVDLAELVRLLDPENESVEVTGRVAGTIPVEIAGDVVHIRDARLASTGPGVIRYRSGSAAAALAAGGESANLLLSALEDFRYSSLVATLNGETTGNLDLTLQVAGANPALYDGYPVELNFTVGGALLEMLRQGLAGYRVPDDIMRSLGGGR